MARKKLSPNNRSTEDEGYSEDINSDSSSELNSRRNTYRKKPKRKLSLKQNRNSHLESTEKGRRKKSQENSSEKREKRPSIIKIFRRIDRKSKNIYLVDDKIEDRNEPITPPKSKSDSNFSNRKKNKHSLEPTSNKISLPNSRASQKPLRVLTEHPTIDVETNFKEYEFEEVSVCNLPGDHDASHPSLKSTCQTIKAEIDFCNEFRDLEESQSSVKGIDEMANKAAVDAWNQPRDTRDLYSPVIDTAETPDKDVWNQPRDADDLYSPVTDIAETPGKDDVWSKRSDLYSPMTDTAETAVRDIWNQSRDTRDSYSPVTDTAKTPDRDDFWHQPYDTNFLYSSVTDITETPGADDVWNLFRDADDLYPYEKDIHQAPNRADVCSQFQNSYFNGQDSKVTEREAYCKTGAFNLLKNDLNVSSDDEIPNSKTNHFSFLFNSDLHTSDFSATDADYTPSEAEDYL